MGTRRERDGAQQSDPPPSPEAPQARDPLRLTGQTIADGTFQMGRLLGAGGMGAVYEAQHLVLRRRCAVKFITIRDNPAAVDRFLREAQIAATLDAPGIARFLGAGKLPDGTPYLATEYLEGETLGDRLKQSNKIGLIESFKIGIAVLETLIVAHKAGIIHRDLKPDNVFLCRDGRVKIIDFGIAHFSDDDATALTTDKAFLGTPAFMAPEQMDATTGQHGRADIDGRADLYALGVMIYRCAVGASPFTGSMIAILAQKATQEPPDMRALDLAIPDDAAAVVRKVMAKKRDDRHRNAEAFKAELAGVLHRVASLPALQHEIGDAPPDVVRTIDTPTVNGASPMEASMMSGRGRQAPPGLDSKNPFDTYADARRPSGAPGQLPDDQNPFATHVDERRASVPAATRAREPVRPTRRSRAVVGIVVAAVALAAVAAVLILRRSPTTAPAATPTPTAISPAPMAPPIVASPAPTAPPTVAAPAPTAPAHATSNGKATHRPAQHSPHKSQPSGMPSLEEQ